MMTIQRANYCSIAGSLQRLLSSSSSSLSSSSQSFYFAKPKTDLYSFVGFLLTATSNFLCFYTYTVWVGRVGGIGASKPPASLTSLACAPAPASIWDGAHPVTKLPSLRQLMPGNGGSKVSIREEKNKDNSNDNVIYDNVYRRRQIKSAKIQLSRPYKYLTLKP